MIKKNYCVLAGLVLVLSLTGGCRPGGAKSGANYFATDFQDESQFIVENIVTDLAEQIYYAKLHRVPASRQFRVAVAETADSPFAMPTYDVQVDLDKQVHGLKTKLAVTGPIWSPEVYEGVAAMLAKAAGLNATAAVAAGNPVLLTGLADGLATTLEKENQRLSAALEKDFKNPALHEQAALLLGAFALREHSGDFYEIRSPLCRMTAHLAMARLLGGGHLSTPDGRLAGALLLTLMNNEAAALKALGALNAGDPATASWVRALQARNTGDYRPLDAVRGLSGVESAGWFYALEVTANTDVAWARLTEARKRNVDFVRLANEQAYSTGAGRDLLALALPLEYQEITSVYELARRKKFSPDALVSALNVMPERCISAGPDRTGVQVIGWGLWAGFLQRQLCHAVEQNFDNLQRIAEQPEDAARFSAKWDGLLGGLRLYPFVRRFNCTNAAACQRAVDDGLKVTIATPQLVPARCWNFLCYGFTPQERSSPAFNPHINEWHRHNPPPGTAYNLLPRLDHPSLAFRPDAGDLVDKLHVLAPYDCNLNWFIWEVKFKANPTLEQATTLFQAILPYNSFAMEKVAATVRDQPARCEHLLAQAAEFNPAFHFALADYYAGHNADDQAAACIEKGTRLDPDPVQAAARASWLIKYYLKKGQLDAARREADLAGNGFSNRFGLQAKAEFLEATGNYPAADQWFGKILERYHDPEPVIAFCLRYKNQTGDARYDGELHQRVGGLFPRGIETVRLADLKTPPRDGALIQAENSSPFTASLHPGDVIVAVMGLRVHNVAQYTCARESTTNSLLDMIVWQGRGYHEIKSNPPGHRLGVELDDYMAR